MVQPLSGLRRALPIVLLLSLFASPARADGARPPQPSPRRNHGAIALTAVGGLVAVTGFANLALRLALDGQCLYGEGLELSSGPCPPGDKDKLGAEGAAALGISGLVLATAGLVLLFTDEGRTRPTGQYRGLGPDGVVRF